MLLLMLFLVLILMLMLSTIPKLWRASHSQFLDMLFQVRERGHRLVRGSGTLGHVLIWLRCV